MHFNYTTFSSPQVTLETFVAWKKRKLKEKADKAKKESKEKRDKYKAGLSVGLSGREMFQFDPSMAGGTVRKQFTHVYFFFFSFWH